MPSHIEWQDWSPLAFTQASEQHKPVLLSLVTSWSDGCAAMDGTTYVHPDVASIVNERFVAVRVDADRRPDLNERYNLGGWPSTVFLTGAGDVLCGGTYFDAPDLLAMLRQVAEAYRDRAEELASRASRVQQVPWGMLHRPAQCSGTADTADRPPELSSKSQGVRGGKTVPSPLIRKVSAADRAPT